MSRSGTPRYVADVSVPGSSLAVAFSGQDGEHYWAPQCVTEATDNFCVSVWVRSDDPDREAAIVWNGDMGWGIFQRNGEFCGHLNGVGDVGLTDFQTGRWYHLVLVRDGGRSSFYVDGKFAGEIGGIPDRPIGRFWIGATNNEYPFRGQIDEVRVFTFGAGEFRMREVVKNRGD